MTGARGSVDNCYDTYHHTEATTPYTATLKSPRCIDFFPPEHQVIGTEGSTFLNHNPYGIVKQNIAIFQCIDIFLHSE